MSNDFELEVLRILFSLRQITDEHEEYVPVSAEVTLTHKPKEDALKRLVEKGYAEVRTEEFGTRGKRRRVAKITDAGIEHYVIESKKELIERLKNIQSK